jgi:sugar phosphate isomerase/epimerase
MGQARAIFSTGSLYPMDTSICFELAKEAGFDGIEVMCDSRWSTRDPDYLKALANRFNIPVMVLHAPMLHLSRHLPGWNVPTTLFDTMRCTVDLAKAVGAQSIVVHLPMKVGLLKIQTPTRNMMLPWFRNRDGQTFAGFIENDLETYQSQTDVQICVENLPLVQWLGRKINAARWNTVDEWSQIAPCLTMDTTHWATHGIQPMDAYRAANSRIRHIHLSNYDGREHRLPHKGDLDLGALLRQVTADGYDGTVCAELHPDALQFQDETALRQNMKDTADFMHSYLSTG